MDVFACHSDGKEVWLAGSLVIAGVSGVVEEQFGVRISLAYIDEPVYGLAHDSGRSIVDVTDVLIGYSECPDAVFFEDYCIVAGERNVDLSASYDY